MIPIRLARELAYQLHRSGEHERLAHALASIPIFLVMWADDSSEVLSLWKDLSSQGLIPEEYYSAALDRAEERRTSEIPHALDTLIRLFERRGSYDFSLTLSEKLLRWATQHEDYRRVKSAHLGISWIHTQRSEYALAMTHLNEALEVARRTGDERGEALAICNIGIIHEARGRYNESFECCERAVEIYERLGEREGLLKAYGSLGLTCFHLNQYDRAIEMIERQVAGATALGDRGSIAIGIGNLGTIYDEMGQYSRAIECYREYQTISHDMGDPRGVAIASANLGFVFAEHREYRQALEGFHSALAIARPMGHSYLIGNITMGLSDTLIHIVRDEAASPPYLSTYIPESAVADWKSAALDRARQLAEETLAIGSARSMESSVFFGSLLLALIVAEEGDTSKALSMLNALLAQQTTDEEQAANVYYWLWKIGGDPASRAESLQRYESLSTQSPKFEFRKRIAELKGAPIPLSADELLEAAP